MTLLLGVISPVYNWFLGATCHATNTCSGRLSSDATGKMPTSSSRKQVLPCWDDGMGPGPWLKNPKLNEHPVDHETQPGDGCFFSPLLGGVCVFEKLKNSPQKKRRAWGFGERKRGRFGGISQKRWDAAGRHFWTSWTSIWIPLMPWAPIEFSIFVVAFTVLKVELLLTRRPKICSNIIKFIIILGGSGPQMWTCMRRHIDLPNKNPVQERRPKGVFRWCWTIPSCKCVGFLIIWQRHHEIFEWPRIANSSWIARRSPWIAEGKCQWVGVCLKVPDTSGVHNSLHFSWRLW